MDLPKWAKWSLAAITAFAAAAGVARLVMTEEMISAWREVGLIAVVALLAMTLVFLVGAFQSSSWIQRLRARIRRRREAANIAQEQKHCREQFGPYIEAWESFFEESSRAMYYFHEVRNERLPLDLGWPWFLSHLPATREAAATLPPGLRQTAEIFLERIDAAIEKEGREIPTGLQWNSLTDACQEFSQWKSDIRVRTLLPIYHRCNISEPYWPDRLKMPTREQLETLTPPPAPPVDSTASE